MGKEYLAQDSSLSKKAVFDLMTSTLFSVQERYISPSFLLHHQYDIGNDGAEIFATADQDQVSDFLVLTF